MELTQEKNKVRMSKSPVEVLAEKAHEFRLTMDSLAFARRLDEVDHLGHFRTKFNMPRKGDIPDVDKRLVNDLNADCVYLCGHSLGLKPKTVDSYVNDVLDNWATKGVVSHFSGALPAASADNLPKAPMARLVGAKESEVAIMNGLTVNLHILLTSFYKPTPWRHKIIIEERAFCSDMYVVQSQIRLHGYSPETSLITLKPRPGEHILREEDILSVIEEEGDSVSVFLVPGIQYYTGQLLPMQAITVAAHAKGILVGVDAAHAVGNVPLQLHDWDVDFAAWCTYKYLNSGAGCLGAIFVHERFTENGSSTHFPMLRGWWGNKCGTKFLMNPEFDACYGADMMKMSNPPVVLVAMLMASLEIYSQTSMEEISRKQFLLTGYLEYLIKSHFAKSHSNESGVISSYSNKPTVEIITPSDPTKRGSQLSLMFSVPVKRVQLELEKRGVVFDIRHPNVMRIAPVPLYNSFADVYNFVTILSQTFESFENDEEMKSMSPSQEDEGVDGCSNSEPSAPASPSASSTECNSHGMNSDSECDTH
ncbi:Kynureninase [Halotydeus destructor]|nr:Kynureninase [Halotydeus destructor]